MAAIFHSHQSKSPTFKSKKVALRFLRNIFLHSSKFESLSFWAPKSTYYYNLWLFFGWKWKINLPFLKVTKPKFAPKSHGGWDVKGKHWEFWGQFPPASALRTIRRPSSASSWQLEPTKASRVKFYSWNAGVDEFYMICIIYNIYILTFGDLKRMQC